MRRPLVAFVLVLVLGFSTVLATTPASAHEPSSSFLTLQDEDGGIAGQWDIALRDLELAVGLDANGDSRITWGELRTARAAVFDYALARLRLSADGSACAAVGGDLRVDRHGGESYAVLDLRADCPGVARRLSVSYSLLFELDAQHRGLFRYGSANESESAIFSDEAREHGFGRDGAPSAWSGFRDYVFEGVRHIAIGADHVLFLVSLLLPSVIRREGGRWIPVESLRVAARDVAWIVTAFTAAHSLTLALATQGLVVVPSRWVESAIAASVALAALHNLVPIFEGARSRMAFGFGLIHGLGFAGVLGSLGLTEHGIGIPLLGFNLGVELGQLAGVLVFLPVAFLLRETSTYRRIALVGGSCAIALMGTIWFAQRAFDLGPLPISF